MMANQVKPRTRLDLSETIRNLRVDAFALFPSELAGSVRTTVWKVRRATSRRFTTTVVLKGKQKGKIRVSRVM
jgi:hypothetical protein